MGPIIFNIFINDLDDRTEYTFSKFANDSKVEVAACTADGCTAIQRHLYSPEKHTNVNLTEFNKAKCQVLHLEGNNPMRQYRLQAKQLESSTPEKD